MGNHLEFSDVDRYILLIRGQRVMLDRDLAKLYGVQAIRLREQVKRNQHRFPEDFMFQLSENEAQALVSQNVIPSRQHLGGYLPLAFTEHGAVMLASVLNSEVAVAASIQIVRAFNRMRRMLTAHRGLAVKLAELERKFGTHDVQIQAIFAAIRRFLEPPPQPPREIGFKP
jgi:hypothetical protein